MIAKSIALAAIAAAIPMAEQGAWGLARGRGQRSAVAARRWVAERLPALLDPGAGAQRLEASGLLGGLSE